MASVRSAEDQERSAEKGKKTLLTSLEDQAQSRGKDTQSDLAVHFGKDYQDQQRVLVDQSEKELQEREKEKEKKLQARGKELQEEAVQLEKEQKNMKKLSQQKAIFFRVPKVLLNSNQQYYISSMVSIGPYHYRNPGLTNPDLTNMEPHKLAVLRMEKRMRWKCPNTSIKSIIERDIKDMDCRVRKCYKEKIPYKPNELAWILTRDACFVFEFILNYLRIGGDDINIREDEKIEVYALSFNNYDPVLNASRLGRSWDNIACDLILFAAYFSKPWLVAGSMGATLLLLTAILQGFCLFYTSNPESNAKPMANTLHF